MSGDKRWLVKSSDHILGPFLFDEVVENIFKGETHLLDEIKGPYERWRPIKDHSLFAAAIEKLKAATYKKREKTVTGTHDLSTKTFEMTHEMTQSETSTKSLGHTKTPSSVENETRESTFIENQDSRQYQSIKSQSRKKSSNIFLISFVFFILSSVGYLVYEFQQSKLIEKRESTFNQLTDKGLFYLKIGDYDKALKNFSMAANISPNDSNLLIEMAPLSIQFDGQFSRVEIQVSNLLASNYNKEYIVRAKNIMGLTHSYRSNPDGAVKLFDEALATDPHFLPALLNKAFGLLKLNRPEEAVIFMQEIVKEYQDEPTVHYLYIKSLVESGLKNKDKSQLNEALSVAHHFSQKFFDLKQEVLFLSALAHLNLEIDKDAFANKVKNFLKVDFELTNLHVHNTQIDFQMFNWIDSANHCQSMIKNLDEYVGKMLEGFCFLKINRVIDAKKIFEILLSQKDNDGVLQALYISTLLKLEDLSQAKNALGFVDQVDQKQPVVETLLRGCLISEDINCVEALFKGKHAKHISLLYSHWGNSEINFSSNLKMSKKSIQLGLSMSPQFSPLLKLKLKE